ncbi:MAG: hypothetical protein RIS92_371 [Verrucomicrobiota bacterium]|jgi:uncharacterized protein YqeY
MSLQAQIDNDIKQAMKERQMERLTVLRNLKSALKNAAIEAGGLDVILEDAAALQVVRKEAKKLQDAIAQYESGGRPDLAAKEQAELAVVRGYLPQPLSEEEVRVLVAACVAEVGATGRAQMGAVMKLATERAAGRVDGRVLSTAVGAALSN